MGSEVRVFSSLSLKSGMSLLPFFDFALKASAASLMERISTEASTTLASDRVTLLEAKRSIKREISFLVLSTNPPSILIGTLPRLKAESASLERKNPVPFSK